MQEPVGAELFIIGNEILIGDIRDTNTHWLCGEINRLGGRVGRVTVLPDDTETIAVELKRALARGPALVLTSGGLGPTVDDLTLAAVAAAAGVELRLDAEALRMVRERYDELAAAGVLAEGGLNPAREKMAWLPAGGAPLENRTGTAPGVLLRCGRSAIVSLPGVPEELKGIFAGSLQPLLRQTFPRGVSVLRAFTVASNDESVMEPVLTAVVRNHPRVYLKSLARPLGGGRKIDVILTAAGEERGHLTALIDAACRDLQAGLALLGIGCRERDEAGSPAQPQDSAR